MPREAVTTFTLAGAPHRDHTARGADRLTDIAPGRTAPLGDRITDRTASLTTRSLTHRARPDTSRPVSSLHRDLTPTIPRVVLSTQQPIRSLSHCSPPDNWRASMTFLSPPSRPWLSVTGPIRSSSLQRSNGHTSARHPGSDAASLRTTDEDGMLCRWPEDAPESAARGSPNTPRSAGQAGWPG